MRSLPATTLFLLVPMALAIAGEAAAVEHYEGLAYDRKSGRLLYRESHWVQGSQRVVLYRCPKGEPFARKRVSGSTPAPDFELVDGRDGYREGVRTRSGMREVYSRASEKAAEQSKRLPAKDNQVIDAGFDAYIRQQWDALASPDRQHIAFLVPSRLQDMDFKLGALAGSSSQRRYTLDLDAWYGGVVPGLTVTYAAADRRLLRYEGIGNIRTPAGKYPTVRIEFPADQRSEAAPSQLDAAAKAPLVSSCGAA